MENDQAWKNIIQAQTPVRVLNVVYPSSLLFKQFEESSDILSVKLEALQILGASENDANTLALSIWPQRVIVVFDLYHSRYDFQTAHHRESIPVLAIHFQTKEKVRVGVATGPSHEKVNQEVADLHKWHGYEQLPFVEDHRNGNAPTHLHPRSD